MSILCRKYDERLYARWSARWCEVVTQTRTVMLRGGQILRWSILGARWYARWCEVVFVYQCGLAMPADLRGVK